MIKTLSEIIDAIITKIQERFGNMLDVRIGTVIRDCFISPFAYIISLLYQDFKSLIDSLDIRNASGQDLDNIASFYGIVRKASVPATGIVRFYAFNPIMTIIPIGTKVFAIYNGQRVEFATLHEAQITNTSPMETDASTGFKGYRYTDVVVQCAVPGVIGNVPVGAIKYCELSSIDGVYNYSSFNTGQDQQNDESLRNVIINALYSKYHTIGGYERFIYENSNVYDVAVLPSDHPDCFLPYVPGYVDIFCITENSLVVTDIATYISTGLLLTKHPLKRILSIYLLDNQGNVVSEVTNYSILWDTSLYRYSVLEKTYINIPDATIGQHYKVTYEYYSDIYNLQNLINAPENRIIGSNVLIRYGEKLNLSVIMRVKPLVGYGFSEIATSIQNAILNYVNALKFGDKIEISDIYSIAYVQGVDYITDLVMKINNETVNMVVPKVYQYIRIDLNNIVINPVL